MDKEDLINITFNKELFIQKSSNNSNIINDAYFCQKHKESYNDFCFECKENICEKCQNEEHKNHSKVKENSENIIDNLEKIIISILKKLNNKFKKKDELDNFNIEIVKLFYCHIINSIIKEKKIMIKEKKFNYYIDENLINAYERMKHKKPKKHNKERDINSNTKIMWITQFYSKEQILNKKNENIFIAIDQLDFVIIYEFDFKNNEKKEMVKIISKNKIDTVSSGKIIKLNKCFNPKDIDNDYFLIGSRFENYAIIIKVTKDYKKIENVQTIKYKDGLIFSYEIKLNNNYYLIHNYNENFSLWNYDEKKKELSCYKIIKPYLY